MRELNAVMLPFTRRRRRFAELALGAAWLVSLALPAAHLADREEAPGLVILMIGVAALAASRMERFPE